MLREKQMRNKSHQDLWYADSMRIRIITIIAARRPVLRTILKPQLYIVLVKVVNVQKMGVCFYGEHINLVALLNIPYILLYI